MSRLRVAVDATAIPGARVGAPTYLIELLAAVDPSDVDLHVFVKRRDADDLASAVPHATMHPVAVSSRPARIAWSASVLPARARKLSPDVFFGPHYTLPAGLACPAVVTFHDPTFFTLPALHERKKVAYFTRAARAGIKRAIRVIVPSSYARQGAIEHAGADPAKVDVVYEGVALDRYRPRAATPEGRPFVLFVGTIEPRKDVPTLIAAFDRLDVPHELVLVGPDGWGTPAVHAAMSGAKKASIRRTGYVDEPEKIRLYQGASAFVYPSIAEGFGLPVLEALACGAPVVTTTGSAPEEVAAGSALLVPPRDADALAAAIERVLADEALADDLRRRGPERAQVFTWEATAVATVDVWRRASEGRTP